jgi:molybdate transport system ATP-binding protein
VDTHAPLIETLSELDFSSQLGEEASVILDTKVTGHDELGNLAKLSFRGGEIWLNEMALGFSSLNESIESIGQTMRLRIMAKDVSITLSRHSDTSMLNILSGTIEEIVNDTLKGLVLVKAKVGESFIIARVTQRSVHHLKLDIGKDIWLQIKSVALVS